MRDKRSMDPKDSGLGPWAAVNPEVVGAALG